MIANPKVADVFRTRAKVLTTCDAKSVFWNWWPSNYTYNY